MTKEHLGRIALVSAGAAIVAVTLLAVRVRRNAVPPPSISSEPMVLHGFRSALYDGNRVRLRVSGDSITLSNARLFGPFSLGFMYALVARNVTLETFPRSGEASQPPARALSLEGLSGLMDGTYRGMQLASAELEPVRVIEHRNGQDRVLLQATFCRASVATRRVVCRDGTMDRNGTEVIFRELDYDGDTVRTRP